MWKSELVCLRRIACQQLIYRHIQHFADSQQYRDRRFPVARFVERPLVLADTDGLGEFLLRQSQQLTEVGETGH